MSCPFYGHALLGNSNHILVFTSGNRCALITDAHSPCYMEVQEHMSPEWENCVRHPLFVARITAKHGITEFRSLFNRFDMHANYMAGLINIQHRVLPITE